LVKRRGSGQGTVEFALIAPTFFVLLFMIMEAALFINAQVTIDNATREAARVAGLCGSSKAAAVTYNGVPYQGQPTPCRVAVEDQVFRHLGFLTPSTVAPVNPTVKICTPPPVTGVCSAAYSGAVQGGVIQVDVAYDYTYWVHPLLGSRTPKTTLASRARVVSQQ
jgi:Flp pilus assembly protein TadG